MYEQGLMVKITNPEVLAFIRADKADESNTRVVETALCRKLGIPPRSYGVYAKKLGKRKSTDCRRAVPVKISDPGLIEHVMMQKRVYGICHRHTVESAVLSMKESAAGGRRG